MKTCLFYKDAYMAQVREARRVWMEENPSEDGRDQVTPFDQFLYGIKPATCPAVAELIRLVDEIDGECSNNKPDFGRVVKLAAEAAALARVGGA